MNDRKIVFSNCFTALHMTLSDGCLFTDALEDKKSGYRFENSARKQPLFTVPGFDPTGALVEINEYTDDRNGLSATADVMSILFTKGEQKVKLELRTYADNPFIRASLSLEGRFGSELTPAAELLPAEAAAARRKDAEALGTIFACPISERHIKLGAVVLNDVTDFRNILVERTNTTVYSRMSCEYRGQIFMIDSYLAGAGIMAVKEAPCSRGRVADTPFDLRIEPSKAIMMVGLGANFNTKADYTFDIPLFGISIAPGKVDKLERAWRDYYRLDIKNTLERGLVSMSNTWGDRHQDAAVCEAFMLGEVERAKKLGVTSVQIDDGWQKGLSANSALGKGTLWGSGYYASDRDYWTVNPTKFPRGLTPIVESAREGGIKLGLWFSPDLANNYESWETDAETLLGLHREYGVAFFKLDGITLNSKLTERRLAAMIERVHLESRGAVSFNFDITAQRRWGYLYKREFGNLFVENRYTDSLSYYPHSTLRTVWMLSRYIPTAKLQMEFLNPRRNAEKYGDDPLAPNNYSIDWIYAAVMFANPLYWMEMTYLSDDDCEVLSKIAKLRLELAPELAYADVTGIGDEPDGINFTGLRADCADHGYLLLFRECSTESSHDFALPELAGKRLTRLYGSCEAEIDGECVHFEAPCERSFGLYRYE